mmetsp:Transcript_104671/g.301266  ORF Transcript_104671/g.301266 Transcript_104671/m.301266 type:complete len:269 (+) Transcript_104671:230-1036(+)
MASGSEPAAAAAPTLKSPSPPEANLARPAIFADSPAIVLANLVQSSTWEDVNCTTGNNSAFSRCTSEARPWRSALKRRSTSARSAAIAVPNSAHSAASSSCSRAIRSREVRSSKKAPCCVFKPSPSSAHRSAAKRAMPALCSKRCMASRSASTPAAMASTRARSSSTDAPEERISASRSRDAAPQAASAIDGTSARKSARSLAMSLPQSLRTSSIACDSSRSARVVMCACNSSRNLSSSFPKSSRTSMIPCSKPARRAKAVSAARSAR